MCVGAGSTGGGSSARTGARALAPHSGCVHHVAPVPAAVAGCDGSGVGAAVDTGTGARGRWADGRRAGGAGGVGSSDADVLLGSPRRVSAALASTFATSVSDPPSCVRGAAPNAPVASSMRIASIMISALLRRARCPSPPPSRLEAACGTVSSAAASARPVQAAAIHRHAPRQQQGSRLGRPQNTMFASVVRGQHKRCRQHAAMLHTSSMMPIIACAAATGVVQRDVVVARFVATRADSAARNIHVPARTASRQ